MKVVAGPAAAFAAAGHRLFLVGGVVRDLMLGAFSGLDDIDLTTDAPPARIRALLAPLAADLWAQGERFGTIGARVGGRSLEITTHRAEAYDPASRKPVVSFGHSITDDLARRDFTINAMAIALPERTLHDPFGGLDDLEHRLLRTPLSPQESFGDDPLRMLRAARFLPRFDLTAEPGLEAAAAELAGRLAIVSVERVRDELERLLAVADPSRGLAFLARTGLLGQVVPALSARSDQPAVGVESCRLASAPGSVLVRRAGLVLALADEAPAALRRLRYANAEVDLTLRLLSVLPDALSPDPGNPTIRQVVARLGLHHLDDLAQLATNVAAARSTPAVSPSPAAATGVVGAPVGPSSAPAPVDLPFFARYRELAETEDLTRLGPVLTGRQVMDHLGLEPGPEVGRLLDQLRQHRLDQGPMTRDEAYALLDRWSSDAR